MGKLNTGPFVPERIGEWAYWIVERERMRVKRATGSGHPYSKDPVMAGTRWCNVRRMDDKVSQWLMMKWYPAASVAEDLRRLRPEQIVAAALAARMINRPETLYEITDGKRFSKFNYERFRAAMYDVKVRGESVFTNAYIINGASGGPKIEQVLNAIQQCVDSYRVHRYLDIYSMRATAEALHKLPGVGSFIAGQVVADLRWVLNGYDGFWKDRMLWAPPGPGSSKGMKYLLGLATVEDMAGRGQDMRSAQFLKYLPALIELAQLHPKVGPVFEDRKLEAHDIQNTLCELSKYVRVKHGGHAKNSYPPKK